MEKRTSINMKRNIIGEILYKLLILTCKSENFMIRKYWDMFWGLLISNFTGYAKIRIHGIEVKVNIGYTYPVYSKKFPFLNSPLVELVTQISHLVKRKITIIDVGAAIGDTALLINDKCKGKVFKMYCVDGDLEFGDYLNYNLKKINFAEPFITILSADGANTREMIRIHSGTASAQGESKIKSQTLDSLILPLIPNQVDILKIDVDGFDGEVIKGAKNIIKEYSPSIIFEWHPHLIEVTNNDILEVFENLKKLKYNTFLWYNKYGYFSFITNVNDDLSLITKYSKESMNDWHYDIIAIHENSNLNIQKMVDLEFTHLGIRIQ
jgi:FkbM family methyltransferase